jgi:hypothetical protein
MHRFCWYSRGGQPWIDAMPRVRHFVAGPLLQYLSTWPRHGRLGVPADLDCGALCAALPDLIEECEGFALVDRDDRAELLLLPQREGPPSMVLCYGRWPGAEVWEGVIQAGWPSRLDLSCTSWNRPVAKTRDNAPTRGREAEGTKAESRAIIRVHHP